MPFMLNHRRKVIASLLMLSLVLGGCGTKEEVDDDDTPSTTGALRVVNATTQRTAASLLIDGVARETGLARDALSATYHLTAGSHPIALTDGSGSAINTTSPTFAAGSATTLVAWTGDHNAVNYLALDDKESAPTAGRAKLLVFNAARDAGALDVHLTPVADTLGDSPLLGNVTHGKGTTGYTTVSPGQHRLRLTRAGSVLSSSVRLDTTLTLADGSVNALVITPSIGGVLAHALLIQPGAAVTALNNLQARVRIVHTLPANLPITGTFNGASLPALGGAPAVSGYALVPAGTSQPTVTLNGGTLTGPVWTAAPGSETTILILNAASTGFTPQLGIVSDDNRLPASPSGTRLRLVHGLGGIDQSLVLNLADTPIATAGPGTVSPIAGVSAVSDATLSVTNETTTATVYQWANRTFEAGGVYSVFLLGDHRVAVGNGLIASILRDR